MDSARLRKLAQTPIMMSLAQPARVLIDPVTTVPSAVMERRWVVPLLILIVAVVFSGVAVALRVDVASQVLNEMQLNGKLANASESDIAEAIRTAGRVKLIVAVATGLFLTPLMVLLGATVMKLVSFLLGKKARFLDLFAALCVALLPVALFNILLGVFALWQFQLGAEQVKALVPSNLGVLFHSASPKLARLLAGVDFFGLWSASLLGLGVAAAARMRRTRGLMLGFAFYAAYVGVFVVGLPGMGGGHP